MIEISFSGPGLLKKLRKEFGPLSSIQIKLRGSKDVPQFLKKKRNWEKLATKKPPLKFKWATGQHEEGSEQ